jgi:hypothetical protein
MKYFHDIFLISKYFHHSRGTSHPTDNSRHQRSPTTAPLSTFPLPVDHKRHPQQNNGKRKRGKNKTKNEKKQAIENPIGNKEKEPAYSFGITWCGVMLPNLQTHTAGI